MARETSGKIAIRKTKPEQSESPPIAADAEFLAAIHLNVILTEARGAEVPGPKRRVVILPGNNRLSRSGRPNANHGRASSLPKSGREHSCLSMRRQ